MAIRVGVIGLGYGKTVIVPALQATKKFKVVGLANSKNVFDYLAVDNSSIEIMPVDQLISSKTIDLLVVASTPSSHIQLVRRAQARGLAVFCEKPVGTDLAELEAVSNHGFYAGYQFRFSPLVQSVLKEIVANPSSSRGLSIRWRSSGGFRFLDDPEQSAVLANFGSHVIDYVSFLARHMGAGFTFAKLVESKCHSDPKYKEFCTSFTLEYDSMTAAISICRLDKEQQFHEIALSSQNSTFVARHNAPFGSKDYLFDSGNSLYSDIPMERLSLSNDVGDERITDETLLFKAIGEEITSGIKSQTVARLDDAKWVQFLLETLSKGEA